MKIYCVFYWEFLKKLFVSQDEARTYILQQLSTISLVKESGYSIKEMKLDTRLDEIVNIVNEWAAKENHDRCWWYPELLARMATILGIPIPGRMNNISRDEFERGCLRFQNEEYGRFDSLQHEFGYEYLHSE